MSDNFFNPKLDIDRYILNLYDSRSYDKLYGGTKIGPHRSNITAKIDNEYEASLLSTGQQKTIILMILLAQCNILIEDKNINPILLLDEIGSFEYLQSSIVIRYDKWFDIQFFLTGTDKNLFSFVSTKANFII